MRKDKNRVTHGPSNGVALVGSTVRKSLESIDEVTDNEDRFKNKRMCKQMRRTNLFNARDTNLVTDIRPLDKQHCQRSYPCSPTRRIENI